MEQIFSFLRDLSENNDREWFNAHKKRYQDSLERFRGFTASVLGGIAEFDPGLAGLEAKDTIFRIYKDVRFSRDKTPYKTHFGCWMARGGRKSTDAGYYFHLEPGGTFMAAGVYMPPREKLDSIRKEILFQPEAYLKIVRDPSVAENYERGGTEDMLKKGPVGFPKDFEHMEQLKYKHHIFSKNYSDKEVCRDGFAERLVEGYRGLFPLVEYLNHAMSFTGNE